MQKMKFRNRGKFAYLGIYIAKTILQDLYLRYYSRVKMKKSADDICSRTNY